MIEDEVHVCGWTIYRHPSDYPRHYVVRQWWVTDEGGVLHHAIGVLCDTLEEAREHVPAGAICFPRDPEDDAVIYETWM